MFIGHFGPAFLAKALLPDLPLGWSMLAGSLNDFIFCVFVLLGIENLKPASQLPGVYQISCTYPYTHSIPGFFAVSLLWTALSTIRGFRTPIIMAQSLIVLSHFFLEIPVHRADIGLTQQGPFIGWGWFDSAAVTFLLDNACLLFGLYLYAQKTSAFPSASPSGATNSQASGWLNSLRNTVNRYKAHVSDLRTFWLVLNVANVLFYYAPGLHTSASIAIVSGVQILMLSAYGAFLDSNRMYKRVDQSKRDDQVARSNWVG
eukprot:GILK01010925.1.p1 GENE.GILK01010925.1~~GILK01010925.1.p1  ORF type:complete len:260 (-),score=25.42 GILK01010925.1:160-939(-)